jgi:hypothetical protein
VLTQLQDIESFGTLSGANFANLNYYILNSNRIEITYRGVATILFRLELFVNYCKYL